MSEQENKPVRSVARLYAENIDIYFEAAPRLSVPLVFSWISRRQRLRYAIAASPMTNGQAVKTGDRQSLSPFYAFLFAQQPIQHLRHLGSGGRAARQQLSAAARDDAGANKAADRLACPVIYFIAVWEG